MHLGNCAFGVQIPPPPARPEAVWPTWSVHRTDPLPRESSRRPRTMAMTKDRRCRPPADYLQSRCGGDREQVCDGARRLGVLLGVIRDALQPEKRPNERCERHPYCRERERDMNWRRAERQLQTRSDEPLFQSPWVQCGRARHTTPRSAALNWTPRWDCRSEGNVSPPLYELWVSNYHELQAECKRIVSALRGAALVGPPLGPLAPYSPRPNQRLSCTDSQRPSWQPRLRRSRRRGRCSPASSPISSAGATHRMPSHMSCRGRMSSSATQTNPRRCSHAFIEFMDPLF